MTTRRISPRCNYGTLNVSEVILNNGYIYSGTPLNGPALRYNDVTEKWQFSNDGITFIDLGNSNISVSGSYVDKFVEFIITDILEETNHSLPGGKIYTVNNGTYLDIYQGGQLLIADNIQSYDYLEVDISTVKFHKEIPAGTLLTYVIRA